MLNPLLRWNKFTKKIQIYPKGYAKTLFTHPWVQEIEDFILPEPAVINLKHAVITAPVFIDGESALGGVYDKFGEHITSSHHCRRSKCFTANTEKTLEKERLESVKQILSSTGIDISKRSMMKTFGHSISTMTSRNCGGASVVPNCSWTIFGKRKRESANAPRIFSRRSGQVCRKHFPLSFSPSLWRK